MLIKEPVVAKPSTAVRHFGHEAECREALKPHLDAMIDLAVKAGWDRKTATYSVMYLAARTASPSGIAA